MKILLLGAKGQVGSECELLFRASGFDVLPLSRQQLDFADIRALEQQVTEAKPDIVVNACAYTAVDKAETEQGLAQQINATSVEALASVCEQIGAILLHLSTDYVFDGQATTPYTEDMPANPLGIYGSTKYAGEQAIIQRMEQFIILRTSWVFGLYGNNFVKTMLRLGQEREQLSVVSDQWGRPTYAKDIAQVIVDLIKHYQHHQSLPWGIYHCCNAGETTWHKFAVSIMQLGLEYKVLSKPVQVNPIPAVDYPTPAPRPAYSVLNTGKLEALVGPMPDWDSSLNSFFQELTSK